MHTFFHLRLLKLIFQALWNITVTKNKGKITILVKMKLFQSIHNPIVEIIS